MFSFEWAHFPSVERSPQIIFPPSTRTVFAMADLALYRGCVGSVVSFVWTTSQRRPFSTIEFWNIRGRPSASRSISNRDTPNGVLRASRFRPLPSGADVYAAGPDVLSVAYSLAEPWQSMQA